MAWRIPVVGLSAADRHLSAVRCKAVLNAHRVGGARRNLARLAAGGRPSDVLDRRSVARIEEARRPSLRRGLAVYQRLGVRHREPALLKRFTHRSQIFGPLGAVEDLAGALVGL
jgi:hypothetical protein